MGQEPTAASLPLPASGRSLSHPDDIVQSMIDSGLYACGTVATVRDQLVAQWKQLPGEYIVLMCHYAQMPKDQVIRLMKAFMKEIKPALDEVGAGTPEETTA